MLVQWTKDACWNPCWELPHTCILGSRAGAQWHTRAPEQALPALSAAPFPQAATSAGEKGGCLRLLHLCCQLGERLLLVLGFVWLDATVRFPRFVVICPSLVNCHSELFAHLCPEADLFSLIPGS